MHFWRCIHRPHSQTNLKIASKAATGRKRLLVTLGPWIKDGMCREISLQSDNNVHCENLIRRALIRADETLSHFSPGWEPRTLLRRLQTNCCCTFSPDPFLLGRTILRNSYCTLELFCRPVLLGPHFAGAMWRGAFCRVAKKAGWPYGSWLQWQRQWWQKRKKRARHPSSQIRPGGQLHSHVTCKTQTKRQEFQVEIFGSIF